MSGFVQGLVWLARLPDKLNGPQAKAILARIADAVNESGQGCRPLARAWIAEDVGLSEASAKRWIRSLKESGFVSVEGGGKGRGNAPTYSVNVERVADCIPENRLPAAFRSSRATSEKGVSTDPQATKRGLSEVHKGVTGDQKGVHQRPPLQGLSTRITTEEVCTRSASFNPRENEALEEIADAWKKATGLSIESNTERSNLFDAIERNGRNKILEAISARQRSRFLSGDKGDWSPRGMPLSWLWNDDRLSDVLSGKYNDTQYKPQRKGARSKSIFDDFGKSDNQDASTPSDDTSGVTTIDLQRSTDGVWH